MNRSTLANMTALCLVCLLGTAGCASGIPTGRIEMIRSSFLRRLSGNELARNNTIRLSLWRASQRGRGTIQARERVPTYEGDWIDNYLIVRDGAIQFVEDYRGDRYSAPEILVHPVDYLAIGYIDSEKQFHQAVRPPKNVESLLRFTIKGRGDSYF